MERPAFEEKIELLRGALKRAEEIQRQVTELSFVIYNNFQLKISGDAEEFVKDLHSLHNFYVLLKVPTVKENNELSRTNRKMRDSGSAE